MSSGRTWRSGQTGAPDNLKEGTAYAGVGPVDPTPRLYVRSGSTNLFFVVVGKPLASILNLWHREVLRIGAIMMALILFVVGTTLFLAREIGRRAEAEDKLEELATTDALTGLKNRRKFDSEIDLEWRRAARSETPVAVLMIDADHFKAYNDTYGHQAGDQVLVGIAICISDSVRRSGDCPARYGGEEFAVLLPGLSAVEAFTVAETIRLKVEQWSEEPCVTTVSIGVASMTPAAPMELARPDRSRRQGALRRQGQWPQSVGGRRRSRSSRWWLRIPKRHSGAAASQPNLRCAMHTGESRSCWKRILASLPDAQVRTSRAAPRNDEISASRCSRHFSRYFFISARKPSRRSARAMP